MSLAPQNHSPDITDALDGSLTSWYDNVNNCLKSSECVPGNYEYAQSPSYGNQCPIQEGGSTKLTVKCNRFEIIDIDNSYIDAVISMPIIIPPQLAGNEQAIGPITYYVGYKNAFDVIDQYRISSNGDLIYTQNNSNYESFINYLSITDSAKENSPCYATFEKVRARNPNVPGMYITLDNSDEISLTVDIPLKIPLNMFPLLQHLKYYPHFNGVLDIEIFPSYKNLVWINITKGGSEVTNEQMENWQRTETACAKRRNTINGGSYGANIAKEEDEIAIDKRNMVGFAQINCSNTNKFVRVITGEEQNPSSGEQTFRCSTSTLKECHLYVAKYWLKMDVYNALEMNYLQVPLLFPIQTVSCMNFTYPMNTQAQFNLQNTATLCHCDTMYIMFFANSNERTVSHNPEIKAQLMINGKYYPREPLSTRGDDMRFYNLTLDALNINNNPLMTVSKDISDSINAYTHSLKTVTTQNAVLDVHVPVFGDHSNFVFAIPLSTDEDFMGGISSNGSTVQIELVGTRDSMSSTINKYNWTVSPVAIFLEDKIMKIYSSKPVGKPQIQITNATLEQIVMSQGTA